MTEAKEMNSNKIMSTVRILLAASLAFSPVLILQARPSSAQAATKSTQKTFDTAESAAQALIQATGDYDVSALLAIFGPSGEDFIASADPVRDKNVAVSFAVMAMQKNSVVIDPKTPNEATMLVGEKEWPFPVPIVKAKGAWHFDTATGKEEILFRRIGANELDAITVCRGFVEAQRQYALQMHDDVNQYAQKIISSPGKQDGLYWANADGTHGGPVSEAVARAIEEGYSTDKQSAFHGYYFKVLKGQGPAAPMGRLDYVINGIMIGGFALIAVPAEYRVTGVKTFMVNDDGIVYQTDLGPNSLELAKKIELYNPDKTWQRVDDQWPADE